VNPSMSPSFDSLTALGPLSLQGRRCSTRRSLYDRPAPAVAPHDARLGGMERPLDPATLGDHLDRLYRAAYALCGSRSDAEDLVQETYVRVLARPRFLRSDEDIGYLLRVLRNTFIRQLEQRRRRPIPAFEEEAEQVEAHHPQPDEAAEVREVYSAIAALPDNYRDVLIAVDVAGLTYAEAARALRIRRGTVMSRLSRARQRVAASLTDQLPDEGQSEHAR
jgi:RNA polymerase sigma-70 factor, ECF subfamily